MGGEEELLCMGRRSLWSGDGAHVASHVSDSLCLAICCWLITATGAKAEGEKSGDEMDFVRIRVGVMSVSFSGGGGWRLPRATHNCLVN